MTEPLGLRQHIRFGDEIASKVDLIDENKEYLSIMKKLASTQSLVSPDNCGLRQTKVIFTFQHWTVGDY